MRYRPIFVDAPAEWAMVSELGFGCAAIGGRVGRRESLEALGTACDGGVTLYDTARSYGYGQSERVVGEFLRGRRQRVVLCTKFGILPGSAGGWKQRLKPAARAALKIFPGLRKTVQRGVADQFVGGQFSVETMRTSFETSLRELKTDYVDMLLLHAAPATVLAQDDLLEAMGRLVESGKVRVAGISGELPVISEYFEQRPRPLGTAQFALNMTTTGFVEETRRNGDLLLVGNHPFGGPGGVAAARATMGRLRSSELTGVLREKLDAGDPQALPELVLNCVLRGTGMAAVIPAMMQAKHIKSNVRAVEECRFSDEELDLLRGALCAAG
jgi:aryl-alcohol dehydrogenase-like predicted oxidoreductase